MRLVKFREGSFCSIWALDLSVPPAAEDCPAKSFLDGLGEPSRKSLTNVLVRHADFGFIRNERKSRDLGDGIYEFKTTQGGRLLFFYYGPATTILTHGFQKGGQVKAEIARAKDLRTRWQSSEEGKRFLENLERRRTR